jgi:hypothetical protein
VAVSHEDRRGFVLALPISGFLSSQDYWLDLRFFGFSISILLLL